MDQMIIYQIIGPYLFFLFFSKILEKCVYSRVYKFLEKCYIITPKQFSFRAGHSTSSAITEFIHKVTNAFDNKEKMIGLFLDLSNRYSTPKISTTNTCYLMIANDQAL